jgi:hypothetical protein
MRRENKRKGLAMKTDRELMEMALWALGVDCEDANGNKIDLVLPAIQALRDRLAQPEPEPVAIGEEWKPCVKLPIVVHVREQRKGETHVSTREGITPVREDDLIMRGVAGEEYPIGRELFNRTYTFNTALPKREWVGLTDEDWNEINRQPVKLTAVLMAEAKLKEKNNG